MRTEQMSSKKGNRGQEGAPMVTTVRQSRAIESTFAEIVKAFQEEAEKVASTKEEADILATAALVNFLISSSPELFEKMGRIIGRAAIVSSLS
jgi:hypothetical protein